MGHPGCREMQIQPARRSCFPPNQMGAKSKSQVIPSCWKGLRVEVTSGHREGRGQGAVRVQRTPNHGPWPSVQEAPPWC